MCRSRLQPFDWDEYFEWLVDKIMTPDRVEYSLALKMLDRLAFYWSDKFNDDNRSADGIELRNEFADDTYYRVPEDESPCSMLEMMVALAGRMDTILSESGDEKPERWFWEMFDNFGLNKFPDDKFDGMSVRELVCGWLERRFDRNGRPGLFPLKHAEEDQRKVEIWAQMSAYINENYSLI